MDQQPIAILIGALGGQGGGVLAEWLVETATRAGYIAQGTSIPGVAQRTGATTYYVEIHPVPAADLDGKRPVLGLYPLPGCVDLVIASELVEALRIVQNGMVSPEHTMLVTSTSRALTTIEKMSQGDGRLDSERLLGVARRMSRRLVAFDMDEAAKQAGTVVSAVMFGAIAASGVLPVAREQFESVIRNSGVGVDASLRGFARALVAMNVRDSTAPSTTTASPASQQLDRFPLEVRDIVALGVARQIAFQDRTYADLYCARVERVLAEERMVDPQSVHGFAVTRETARFLALWMAFDDVIRVADQKSRRNRFARVRREVGAGESDIVRIVDYLKPGIPEIAGLLPPSIGSGLLQWDRERQQRGREPLAWPLHIRSDSMTGFLLLRSLAAMKRLRRRSARYAQEQSAIERWLDAVVSAARIDWPLAMEFALCGRLVKGYGATNERGKRNLAHIVDHLAQAGAAAVREARDAALADEGGKTLDETLQRHGAPVRPVSARPIVWAKRPRAASHISR
jgi:indolepyruvate ferredoxin oxidoreductase, beta subunit